MNPRLRATAAIAVLAVTLVLIAFSHRPEMRVSTPSPRVAHTFALDPTPPPIPSTTEPPPVTTEAPVIEAPPPEPAPAPPPQPAPQPVAEPAPRYSTPGCAYESLIRSVFVEDPLWALAVAWRESNCQPDARNPSGASGLFQLMLPLHNDLFASVGCTPEQWSDPVCNVNAAHVLYLGSGRAPWSL